MSEFLVYTKPGCPHCDRVKNAIKNQGFEYVERAFITDEQIESFKSEGFRTFPQVFHEDHHVGNADLTVLYLRELVKSRDDF